MWGRGRVFSQEFLGQSGNERWGTDSVWGKRMSGKMGVLRTACENPFTTPEKGSLVTFGVGTFGDSTCGARGPLGTRPRSHARGCRHVGLRPVFVLGVRCHQNRGGFLGHEHTALSARHTASAHTALPVTTSPVLGVILGGGRLHT